MNSLFDGNPEDIEPRPGHGIGHEGGTKDESHEQIQVGALAQALSKLTEIALETGSGSREVHSFLKRHKHLGGDFNELAQECLKQIRDSPRAGDWRRIFSLTSPKISRRSPVAIAASVVLACALGVFAVAHWADRIYRTSLERERTIVAQQRTIDEQGRLIAMRDRGPSNWGQESGTGPGPEAPVRQFAGGQRDDPGAKLNALAHQVEQLKDQLALVSRQRDDWKASAEEKDKLQHQASADREALKGKCEELGKQLAVLQKAEEHRLAQLKKGDGTGSILIATHVLSLIDDADVLRLVLRGGVRSDTVDMVRKLTKDDIGESKKLAEELFTNTPSATEALPPDYQKVLTKFTKEIAHYANTLDNIDPLTASPDVTLAAALLDYACRKQLYALEFRRASLWVRNEATRRRFLSYADSLESAAQELRKHVASSPPAQAVSDIREREVQARDLITSTIEEINKGGRPIQGAYGYPGPPQGASK